jgi:hypothetical protein
MRLIENQVGRTALNPLGDVLKPATGQSLIVEQNDLGPSRRAPVELLDYRGRLKTDLGLRLPSVEG